MELRPIGRIAHLTMVRYAPGSWRVNVRSRARRSAVGLRSRSRVSRFFDDNHDAGWRCLVKRRDLIGAVEQGVQAADLLKGR